MYVEYKKEKLRKQCEELKEAKKKLPTDIAISLLKRIKFIKNAESLSDIINHTSFYFHPLKDNLEGKYAIDIKSRKSPYRLIVVPKYQGKEIRNSEDVFTLADTIEILLVMEVSKHYE